MRHYHARKQWFIDDLVAGCDILCLTEIWSPVEPSNHWTVHNAVKSASPEERNRGGGVALVIPPHMTFRHRVSELTQHIQFIAGTLRNIPIVGCYVSPKTPACAFKAFLERVNGLLRGPGVLVGDLNARDATWDVTYNRRGPILRKWATAHNFAMQRTDQPTVTTVSGSSRVDLCLHRSGIPPSISVHDRTVLSDHAPVTAVLASSTICDSRRIPLALLNNTTLRERISRGYAKSIPPVIEQINEARTWGDLECATNLLITRIVGPWTAFCPTRPNRFRPGWTRQLDTLAKRRSQLFKAGSDSARAEANALDKVIKRRFKENVARIRCRLGDDVNEGLIGSQFQTLSRAMALSSDTKELLCRSVDPDKFLEFMEGLQPPHEAAPRVQVLPFTVPDSLLDEITKKLKNERTHNNKAPGPDGVRLELLRLNPQLFAKATFVLWKAVGRLTFVPAALRSGNLAPVYKRTGEPTVPSNNRPICLISAFRKVISTALLADIERHYTPNLMQWGHRRGSGTEVAIIFAINKLRINLPLAVFLDLKKAFDLVPRIALQKMVDAALPSNLAKNVRALLWPMLLRAKGQTSDTTLITRAGVPQGDPSSPLLFSLFMDGYLRAVNVSPRQAMASLFVDDVLGLACTWLHLMQFLDRSQRWAVNTGMVWNIAKSCGLSLPHQTSVAGTPLPSRPDTLYLGVTVTPKGVSNKRLLERIAAARGLLYKLRSTTRHWRTSLKQRRAFVKTFILSVADYALFLHPLTKEVLEKAEMLDALCVNYIVGLTVPPQQRARARYMTRFLSFPARRRRNTIQTIGRFRARVVSNPEDERNHVLWQAIASYGTTRFVSKQVSKMDLAALAGWVDEQLMLSDILDWKNTNKHKRWIPEGKRLPPALRAEAAPHIERHIIRWYLNNIPAHRALSANKNRLHELLGAQRLSTSQIEELESIILELL